MRDGVFFVRQLAKRLLPGVILCVFVATLGWLLFASGLGEERPQPSQRKATEQDLAGLRVVNTPEGNSLAVWQARRGGRWRVYAAWRRGGDPFGPAIPISGKAHSIRDLHAAILPAHALVVWREQQAKGSPRTDAAKLVEYNASGQASPPRTLAEGVRRLRLSATRFDVTIGYLTSGRLLVHQLNPQGQWLPARTLADEVDDYVWATAPDGERVVAYRSRGRTLVRWQRGEAWSKPEVVGAGARARLLSVARHGDHALLAWSAGRRIWLASLEPERRPRHVLVGDAGPTAPAAVRAQAGGARIVWADEQGRLRTRAIRRARLGRIERLGEPSPALAGLALTGIAAVEVVVWHERDGSQDRWFALPCRPGGRCGTQAISFLDRPAGGRLRAPSPLAGANGLDWGIAEVRRSFGRYRLTGFRRSAAGQVKEFDRRPTGKAPINLGWP